MVVAEDVMALGLEGLLGAHQGQSGDLVPIVCGVGALIDERMNLQQFTRFLLASEDAHDLVGVAGLSMGVELVQLGSGCNEGHEGFSHRCRSERYRRPESGRMVTTTPRSSVLAVSTAPHTAAPPLGPIRMPAAARCLTQS